VTNSKRQQVRTVHQCLTTSPVVGTGTRTHDGQRELVHRESSCALRERSPCRRRTKSDHDHAGCPPRRRRGHRFDRIRTPPGMARCLRRFTYGSTPRRGNARLLRDRWLATFSEFSPPIRTVIVAEENKEVVGMLGIWSHESLTRRVVLSYCQYSRTVNVKAFARLSLTKPCKLLVNDTRIRRGLSRVMRKRGTTGQRPGWHETNRIEVPSGDGWAIEEVEYLRL
jgi:hypothetical protein